MTRNAIPVEAVVRALRRRRRRLSSTYILALDNPTGTVVSREELRRISECRFCRTLVLVDEAYSIFPALTIPSLESAISNLSSRAHFRSQAGLAALRVGCLFGRPELLSPMRRACSPYP